MFWIGQKVHHHRDRDSETVKRVSWDFEHDPKCCFLNTAPNYFSFNNCRCWGARLNATREGQRDVVCHSSTKDSWKIGGKGKSTYKLTGFVRTVTNVREKDRICSSIMFSFKKTFPMCPTGTRELHFKHANSHTGLSMKTCTFNTWR